MTKEILPQCSFSDIDIIRLMKKSYFNGYHDIAKSLCDRILTNCEDNNLIGTAKDYLRKINIYESDKDAFVEMNYSNFKLRGNKLEPQHIIYVTQIRDDYFENQYNEDPKKCKRPYMIWKIVDDRLYCFPISTNVNYERGKHVILHKENYKIRDFDRKVKNNLVCINESDVQLVIDRVVDIEFKKIIRHMYLDMCFQHDMLEEHNEFFVDTISKQFKPKIYDVIRIPYPDEIEKNNTKEYLILDYDSEERKYKTIEVNYGVDEIEIVNYDLIFIDKDVHIINMAKLNQKTLDNLLKKVPSNYLGADMMGVIIESNNKKLEIILEQGNMYICIDRSFGIGKSFCMLNIIYKYDPLFIIDRVSEVEYKKHLSLVNEYMRKHCNKIRKMKEDFYSLQRRKKESKDS